MGSATHNTDTVKIGVLLSLSGPLSATELWHLQGTMLGVDIVNSEGGIDGLPLEPILCDPASAAASYRMMAQELVGQHGLKNVFGVCSSDIRKTLISTFEQHDALLWYPTQFEGFEWSPNVLYGGSCPNQHTLPLADYLLACDRSRHLIIGTDFGFPRANNQVFRDHIEGRGGQVLGEHYLPRGAQREHWMAVIEPYRGRCDAIFSTVVGDDNRPLFEAYHALRLTPDRMPITGFCVCEGAVAEMPDLYAGHISVMPYFESIGSHSNTQFLRRFRRRFGRQARANWPALTSCLQVQSFAAAARLAGSDEASAIIASISQVDLDSPTAGYSLDPDTHYSLVMPHVSAADGNGQFELLHVGSEVIRPDPYLINTA
jgi:branched-chain amino acid transport system substrate-binding protein